MISQESKIQSSNLKIAYFEGRPHGHPTHSLYAKSLDADFFHFDLYLHYHEKHANNKLLALTSWILTALLFPKDKYNIYLTEEPYLAIYLLRKFKFFGKKQKLISILGTHTLYFLKTGKYSRFNSLLFKFIYSQYDAIICEGEMQKEMLNELFSSSIKKPLIYDIPNGSKTSRMQILKDCKPNLSSNRILTIAAVPNKNRLFYKGIDLNLKVFDQLIQFGGNYYYDIIGEFPKELQIEALSNISLESKRRVTFLGQINNFETQIENYSLCLHISRGEAWGISINDCMAAGIPTIVSEWTGSKQIVKQVSKEFIVPYDISIITKRVLDYYSLSLEEKYKISKKCKEISLKLTEEFAIEEFKLSFNEAIHRLNKEEQE